jgi:uncharacterized protein with von Willebrand factor type A (vWA) domain
MRASCQDSSEFLQHFLAFGRKLKDEGIKVTLHQEIDTIRSLSYINIFNRDDFYHSLRSNLISRREDIPIFDTLFSSHWSLLKQKPPARNEQERGKETSGERQEEDSVLQEKEQSPEIIFTDWAKDDSKEELEPMETPVYSPTERLQEKDFSTFSDQDLEEIEKLITLTIHKMRLRESRRKKMDNKARYFDFRRTLRKNIRQGGDILNLYWKKRKITQTRLVLLCDVSGSMERYSRFIIQFLYGMQNSLGSAETFVFSTRLSRITPILRREGFEKALNKMSLTVQHWSGGTNIGECLRAFNRRYAPTLLYRKTIVLIISDGWDRGDEVLLREEMQRLRKKAYHILWLNPLLGSPSYQPICRGMKTALPFLDQFLPFHNLESLFALGETIQQIH